MQYDKICEYECVEWSRNKRQLSSAQLNSTEMSFATLQTAPALPVPSLSPFCYAPVAQFKLVYMYFLYSSAPLSANAAVQVSAG